jgi:hypothetical protein
LHRVLIKRQPVEASIANGYLAAKQPNQKQDNEQQRPAVPALLIYPFSWVPDLRELGWLLLQSGRLPPGSSQKKTKLTKESS